MRRPHTIIGAKQFHFRVRDGIGWYPLAIAARQTCICQEIHDSENCKCAVCLSKQISQYNFELYGQASRSISTG